MKPDIVLLVNYYCFFKVVEVQQDIFIIKKVQQHIKREKNKKKKTKNKKTKQNKKRRKVLNFSWNRFAALTFLSKIFYTQQNLVQN